MPAIVIITPAVSVSSQAFTKRQQYNRPAEMRHLKAVSCLFLILNELQTSGQRALFVFSTRALEAQPKEPGCRTLGNEGSEGTIKEDSNDTGVE